MLRVTVEIWPGRYRRPTLARRLGAPPAPHRRGPPARARRPRHAKLTMLQESEQMPKLMPPRAAATAIPNLCPVLATGTVARPAGFSLAYREE